MDFSNLDYLQTGTLQQKRIYSLLTSYTIFEKLREFSPILAGTFPIDIAIENSDLDIILTSDNLEKLSEILLFNFGKFHLFSQEIKTINQEDILICQFYLEEFPVEIYAKNLDTKQHNAYRHLLVEHEILKKNDDNFKQKIIELKKSGIKTEPAFAKLLNLKGDPYIALLDYQPEK